MYYLIYSPSMNIQYKIVFACVHWENNSLTKSKIAILIWNCVI